MKLLKWLAGLISNPATGRASHSKFWTNVAYATMTYKFATSVDPPEWMWWAYGAMVGGYALIKRGMAVIPQMAQIAQQKGKDRVADDE